MAVRARRELFKRHYEFTAVRPIRLSAAEVMPAGTNIDKSKFRLFHLMSLYRRRRIGVTGSPWTEAMLSQLDNAFARPEAEIVSEIVAPVVAEVVEPTEEPQAVEGPAIEIIEGEKGWRTIVVDGEVAAKVRGQEGVEAWMKESGNASS